MVFPEVVNDIRFRSVLPADPPDISDVMSEGGEREMQPVLRSYLAAQAFAPENVLTDKRHEGRVLGGMV